LTDLTHIFKSSSRAHNIAIKGFISLGSIISNVRFILPLS
jgi:hypothetical protein